MDIGHLWGCIFDAGVFQRIYDFLDFFTGLLQLFMGLLHLRSTVLDMRRG